jgi:hypothetical protein
MADSVDWVSPMPTTNQPGSAWSTVTSSAEAKWQQEAGKATIKVDGAESSCQESSVTIVARTFKELLQSASKEGDVLISRPKLVFYRRPARQVLSVKRREKAALHFHAY